MDGRNRKRKKRFALRRTTLASELLDMRRIEKKMQLDVSQKPSFVLRTRNYQKYKKSAKIRMSVAGRKGLFTAECLDISSVLKTLSSFLVSPP